MDRRLLSLDVRELISLDLSSETRLSLVSSWIREWVTTPREVLSITELLPESSGEPFVVCSHIRPLEVLPLWVVLRFSKVFPTLMILRRGLLFKMLWRSSDWKMRESIVLWEICLEKLDGRDRTSLILLRRRERPEPRSIMRERLLKPMLEERLLTYPKLRRSPPNLLTTDIERSRWVDI